MTTGTELRSWGAPSLSPAQITACLTDRGRLEEIARLGVLDDDFPHRAALRDAAVAAARCTGQPVGVVSIVLDGAQCFVAASGLEGWQAEAGGTPVEWSFCRFTVTAGAPFLVEDARQHPLMHDSPLVTEDGACSYAGVPLITTRGGVIGALCGVGSEPRRFNATAVARLNTVAARLMRRIDPPSPAA